MPERTQPACSYHTTNSTTHPVFSQSEEFDIITDVFEEEAHNRVSTEIIFRAMQTGLWTKLWAENDGNEVVTKANYLKMTVKKILDEAKKEKKYTGASRHRELLIATIRCRDFGERAAQTKLVTFSFYKGY